MSDVALAGLWLAVLGGGIGAVIVLRALGVRSTYLRDLLHIGAGVWVLGWPRWSGGAVPVAITLAALCAMLAVPVLAPRVHLVDRFRRSVTGGDEHWGGLVLYTLAYATFTTLAILGPTFPAAAALLALSLGDGIGGAVGRAAGRHHFAAPGGKTKSLEGSLVVVGGAAVGAVIAALVVGAPISLLVALALGVVAAVTEALSPRGTDNLLLPIAVYAAARLLA